MHTEKGAKVNTLITFRRGFDEPSVSPFCVKAMILLEMSGCPWQRKDITDASKMPYGKVPVLSVNKDLVPESDRIEEWLSRGGADFYPGCSTVQRAVGMATIRMVEEGLRLGLVHDRWIDEACWNQTWPVLFAPLPGVLRKQVAQMVRKSVKGTLKSHGVGRWSNEDRLFKANHDLEALGGILGGSRYFLGDVPTAVDAAVLPVLSAIDHSPVATDLTLLLRSKPWVPEYLLRARKALYGTISN